jgi:hypothetical protein
MRVALYTMELSVTSGFLVLKDFPRFSSVPIGVVEAGTYTMLLKPRFEEYFDLISLSCYSTLSVSLEDPSALKPLFLKR